MKTFYDLTSEEKINLSEEQVDYYTKIECANRGIIIPLKPIIEIKEVLKPTARYYQVGYNSFVFNTEQEAQNYVKAAEKALSISNIGNNYDSKHQYVKGLVTDSKEIKSVILYTKNEADEIKETIIKNTEAEKEWSAYQKSMEQLNSISNNIWDEISEIKFKNQRILHYKKVYSDYLELSGNNEDVAFSFFKKAYENQSLSDIDKEIVSEIINSPRIESEK